eukprot:CAMPEP_0179011176 /NCGR_PEP_ID=MMETSP0796-20121207/524_1 /TAXON_ID=73915 /ORGANISM="Pyrodinium bahamense, Strain pbaha01" /LENGTH=128 /DNA_ID=CAMNT_0020706537 /DNA_START=1998 /DNA_END=2382 /DNA_ORIENTATION=-
MWPRTWCQSEAHNVSNPHLGLSDDTALSWAPAATKAAFVTVFIASHLGPITHGGQSIEGGEFVDLHRFNLDVLRVGPDPTPATFMRNPYWMTSTIVADTQALSTWGISTSQRNACCNCQTQQKHHPRA